MTTKNIQQLAKSIQLNINDQQAEKMVQEYRQIIVQLNEFLAVDQVVTKAGGQLVNGLSLADDQVINWLDDQSLSSAHLVSKQAKQINNWLVVPNIRSKN